MTAPTYCELCAGHGLVLRRNTNDDLWGAPCKCSRGHARRPGFVSNTEHLKRIGAPLHTTRPTTDTPHNTESTAA